MVFISPGAGGRNGGVGTGAGVTGAGVGQFWAIHPHRSRVAKRMTIRYAGTADRFIDFHKGTGL
jgi:hypothetical protein